MENTSNNEYLRASRYDNSEMEYDSMYDRMPFMWDADLNVEKILTKVSGNLIKFYRCKIKDSYELKHK